MAATEEEKEALNQLRQQIDAIDNQIHDLLMQRTKVIHRVAETKNEWIKRDGGKLDNDGHPVPSLAMRPEREASIFRRLKSRHNNDLPFHVIIQLWRELINAKTRLQGPLAISLFHGDETILPYGSRDLARASYGAATRLVERETPFSVLDDVMRKAGVIGVLPEPVAGEGEPWWPLLLEFDNLETDHVGLRIIARLPCVTGDPDAPAYPVAWTIACFEQLDSGDDTSFLIVGGDCAEERVVREAAALGLGATVRDRKDGLSLVEVAHFVAHDDPRLAQLGEALGARFVRHVGGYANPVDVSQ